jgi:hypothetical protein
MNVVNVVPPQWNQPGEVPPHTLDESCPCLPVLEAVPLAYGGVGYTLTHHPLPDTQKHQEAK